MNGKYQWSQVCEEAEAKEQAWIADLRAKGVAAAHPNDRWVRWDSNEVCFCYPQFRDSVTEGSLVVLGDSHSPELNRLIRITGRRVSLTGVLVWWKFEEVRGGLLIHTPCPTCHNYKTKLCDTCTHNIPKLLAVPVPVKDTSK